MLQPRRARRRGQSVVETALIFPWLVFLFVGALDAGFYMYALIGVQSAARIAVLYTSSSATAASDSSGACTLVLKELSGMPNIGAGVTSCGALPVIVTATGPTMDQFGNTYSTVSVQYKTLTLMPIPGILAGNFTLTRVARMQIRS